jgi:hypothetical protein
MVLELPTKKACDAIRSGPLKITQHDIRGLGEPTFLAHEEIVKTLNLNIASLSALLRHLVRE